jgi:2-hydroxy-3-keto-5-methylthiopentenyl-1-phosphate phosphatase
MSSKSMKPIVLTDFDGTACRIDIGESLMKQHAGPQWPGLIADWKTGRITTVECFTRECEWARLSRETIVSFARKQSLEPSFLSFLSVLRPQGVPLVILSDGLDIYIELLLEQHHIRDVAFFANHAAFPEGRLVPEFPYYEQGCGACGNCKGSHVRRYHEEGYSPVVFVGNGLSDRCVVGQADILFAKDDLLDYARSKDVEAIPFLDFQDVHREMVKRKVIK